MKILNLILLLLIVPFISCVFLDLAEAMYGPLDGEITNDHYHTINNTKDIRLNISFIKKGEPGQYKDDYISIKVMNNYGLKILIKDGYMKLNDILLREGNESMTYYYSYKVPISTDRTYTLELKLSNGKIYKEALELPTQTISGFNAPSIDNLSDSVSVDWDDVMPEGNVLLISEARFTDGSRPRDTLNVVDGMYSFTFKESTFVKEPFINDSFDYYFISISLNVNWINTDFSENFACSSFINFSHSINKIIWNKQ